MVMGPTHAVSGAAAWLAGAGLTAAVFGHVQNPVELAVYTAVCAGSALLPDLDCSGAVLRNRGGATVAHTFGVASLFLAECVEKFSLLVYRLTATGEDSKRTNGHRTLTHTWAFNVLLGLGAGWLCESVGKAAVVGILFFTFGLAVRGLMAEAARKSGWILITLLAAAAAGLAILTLPSGRGYPLLGVAVAAGGVIHTLGDMITRHGCPVIWPLIWRRQRWWEFGIPDPIAVPVNGWFERVILLPGLTALAIFSAAWAVPALRAAMERVGDYVSGFSGA